jgi:hypothetical protein
MTSWQFELDGDGSDRVALMPLASVCNCTVQPGPGGQLWLGGARFDGIDASEESLEEAKKALNLLNGLARLESQKHRPIGLGSILLRDGAIQHHKPFDTPRRGAQIEISQPPALGAELVTGPPVDAAVACRRERIVSEPKVAEILVVFADEITWQRMRVALEKINALVGKGDNALVKRGYATQPELTKFKANIEDPRLSGADAVHGVPQEGPLRGEKMSKSEGFDFLVRLFNRYVCENL